VRTPQEDNESTTEFAAVFDHLDAASLDVSVPSARLTLAHFPLQKYKNASRACKRLDAGLVEVVGFKGICRLDHDVYHLLPR
jgi:hypothetical protein